MLLLQNATYLHPNGDVLFSNLNLTIQQHDKIALIGNNGTGKSTLLRILAGSLPLAEGLLNTSFTQYFVPQITGQFNNYTVARAMQAEDKLQALKDILAGNMTDSNMVTLGDDWTIEERCRAALAHWQLAGIDMDQGLHTLSGGQKTKVFLAGIMVHQPDLVLLDEPSNHLDTEARAILYRYISTTTDTLVVVSHDRMLLNMLPVVLELSKRGIAVYGGNYDFYAAQKMIESSALEHDVKSTEKALRKARDTEREAVEREQKLDARGKKKQEKAGVPTIAMNTLRNNAEKSTSRMKNIHAGKTNTILQELDQLRKELPAADKMKMGFDNSALHRGKILVDAQGINAAYEGQLLWEQPLNMQVLSGERIAISGGNGSGKTTLIKILLGYLQPYTGTASCTYGSAVYIDQDYSIINNHLTVYQQVQEFNSGIFQEHEIKIRLTRFLFTQNDWNKPCLALSGGEKMRLILCCLTVGQQSPDIIVLDEPTNNLDMQNIEILTTAINQYHGTLIVISHDEYFLEQINVRRAVKL